MAIQRPGAPAGSARSHGSAAARGGGGGAGAGAGIAPARGAACAAARPYISGGGGWAGGAGLGRGAACAGSAAKPWFIGLSVSAPGCAWPPYNEYGGAWRAARCGAGQAAWRGLPVSVPTISNPKPPRGAIFGRGALVWLGAEAPSPLYCPGGYYRRQAWRGAAPRCWSGRNWRADPGFCCISATVMWPSRGSSV